MGIAAPASPTLPPPRGTPRHPVHIADAIPGRRLIIFLSPNLEGSRRTTNTPLTHFTEDPTPTVKSYMKKSIGRQRHSPHVGLLLKKFPFKAAFVRTRCHP